MATNRKRCASLARHLLSVLTLIVVAFPTAPGIASPPAQPGCITFDKPGVYREICGRFAEYWRLNGGLAQQGYPLTPEINEVNQQDGKTYKIQYFQRAVFELHPENRQPNDVQLSLLGAFLYDRKYPTGAPNQIPNRSPGSMFFEKRGKRLGGRFLEYWQANGGLAQQGMPISDEFREVSPTDGKPYTVQYFERAVFELHPEYGRPNDVLLSLLGVFRLQSALVQKYGPDDVPGWVCHTKGSNDSRCTQHGTSGPPNTSSMRSEQAKDGPPPYATLAERGDILLSNTNGTLHVRYAARDLRLMHATKLALWSSAPCTQPDSVTVLGGEVLVDDQRIPLGVAAGNICIAPRGTVYGARLWPDGSADVAVAGGSAGALVIDPTGRTSKVILPGQQVHASPAGVIGQPGPIDAEFEKNFGRYTAPNLQPVPPTPDPPRSPNWSSSLLRNGDFESGTLEPWTTQVERGSGAIVTRPVRAGRYSAMVTSMGIAGGGSCPEGNRVPVDPYTPYSWLGWVFIPQSEARPTASLRVTWFTACAGGSAIGSISSNAVQATGQWSSLIGGGTAPGNAKYAEVRLMVVPSDKVTGSAYFDDVQMNVAGPANAPPTPIETVVPTVPQVAELFSEGFESGYGNLKSDVVPTSTIGLSGWQRMMQYTTGNGADWKARSGEWFVRVRGTSSSASQLLSTIKPIDIPANAASATLSFWHIYDLGGTIYPYPAPHAGVLEISTDGGKTWGDASLTTTFLAGAYNGTTGPAAALAGHPFGDNRAGWIGKSGGAYTQVVVDLKAYAGRTLWLRFNLGSPNPGSERTGGIGWQIDDILVRATYSSAALRIAGGPSPPLAVLSRVMPNRRR